MKTYTHWIILHALLLATIVPFDKITDCDVTEPAGNSCFCVVNVLSVVNIDTASSGADGSKELRLAGLKNPHGFKTLVWAMKRSQQQQQEHHPNGNEEMTSLLREIRDEVRHNNELLKEQMHGSNSGSM